MSPVYLLQICCGLLFGSETPTAAVLIIIILIINTTSATSNTKTQRTEADVWLFKVPAEDERF